MDHTKTCDIQTKISSASSISPRKRMTSIAEIYCAAFHTLF